MKVFRFVLHEIVDNDTQFVLNCCHLIYNKKEALAAVDMTGSYGSPSVVKGVYNVRL